LTKIALKVIHIHFGKEGGAERFFVKLAQALDRRGVQQRFIIRPGRQSSMGRCAMTVVNPSLVSCLDVMDFSFS
jgi:hypothetical protein